MFKICSFCLNSYMLVYDFSSVNLLTYHNFDDYNNTNICYDCFNCIDEEVPDYMCRICTKSYLTKEELNLHFTLNHNIEINYFKKIEKKYSINLDNDAESKLSIYINDRYKKHFTIRDKIRKLQSVFCNK